MAIVEDEVRNESEEENEIEVVVEEDDGDQDSDDSDDDDDEEALEQKVAELECRITQDPYNYDDHIDLIQALWSISELERWRVAFDRLQKLFLLKPEHWLLRLQTEVTLAHSQQSRERIANLFQQAALDCYSIPILSEWCTWALSGSLTEAREQLDEVLTRAGADPLSGKLFWDARLELEKSQLEAMSEADAEYKTQQESVLWCLEEASARPLLRAEEAWPQLRELATTLLKDDKYIDKAQKQHEAAMSYLQKITPFEDKLLTQENVDEKCATYQEYIDTVKELARDDKFAECDSRGILKVLYDRATTECLSCASVFPLVLSWAREAERTSSRATYGRVLGACARRVPTKHVFWTRAMQLAEKEGKEFDHIKSLFETALSKGMDSYKEAEALWLGYLEYTRRQTDFGDPAHCDRLRNTFRLAWDSLAEAWGEEANDCEVPLYWARLEYRRLRDHKAGKDILEEIFKYGENKSMSKYWEALISLESHRSPPPSEHKLRELYRRALRFVADYPPGVARLYTDYERDYGELHTQRECTDACEAKIKEWRENYQAMKEKMTGQKQKGKQQNKKNKFDNKKKRKDEDTPKKEEQQRKGKRKGGENSEGSEVKRKRDGDTKVEASDKDADSGGGVKRPLEDEDSESVESKRMRAESVGGAAGEAPAGGKDACTLFVSNLEFKVSEERVRSALAAYGPVVSLRVRAGVKAFGGSICYCQYSTPEAVEEALKHDRTPLDGRPMFFSRYTASRSNKPAFKYATTAEKNKLFVKNLPFSHCTKEKLQEIFDKHGKLKDVRVVTHKDGKPKGLAYIEYEDEASAAAALEKTNGLMVESRALQVAVSAPPPKKEPLMAPSLGQPKREATGGMRRTQLSSLIPSVLQRPSTSRAVPTPAPSTTNGTAPAPAPQAPANGDKRPLSNADFRSLLLK